MSDPEKLNGANPADLADEGTPGEALIEDEGPAHLAAEDTGEELSSPVGAPDLRQERGGEEGESLVE